MPWDGLSELYIALYTAAPTESQASNVNEANYGGYARLALNRLNDFTVTGNQVSNTNLEQFAQCSSGTNTITHACIVDSASGAGNIIAIAELNTAIPVSTGIQPQFASGGLSWTLD